MNPTCKQRIGLMWIKVVQHWWFTVFLARILYSFDNGFHIVGWGCSQLIVHQKESRIAFYEVSYSKLFFCVVWCNLKAWAACPIV